MVNYEPLQQENEQERVIGRSNEIIGAKPNGYKNNKELATTKEAPKVVLASRSVNSEYEPAVASKAEVAAQSMKRQASPIIGTNISDVESSKRLKSSASNATKRPSIVSDVYIDGASSDGESTEDDEEEYASHASSSTGSILRPVSSTAQPRGVSKRKPKHEKWREMNELDFPVVSQPLPSIQEDDIFDIPPACDAISPPLYIPKFIAQVDNFSKQIQECISNGRPFYECFTSSTSSLQDLELFSTV